MLKKISLRKIMISTISLFAITLLYFMPSNEQKLKIEKEIEYVGKEIEESDIFLIDKNSYVALTSIPSLEKDIEKKAKELIKILTVGGMDSKVPSGFSAILPPDTEVLSITYDHNVLKVNFSKELLEIEKNLEEKMIEALVYTLTSIDKVDKIIIYVEGDILTKLPKTKINLPSTLDRNFGINKEFNLTSTKDITDVTVYYINQINENYYYVPVTKYLNDNREKIDIIIEELSVGLNPNKNLKSYLTEDVKIVTKNVNEKSVSLEFKEKNIKEINENIDKTIALSVCETYKIEGIELNKSKRTCKHI
ncbi:MAG: GerMN domain-containing protein [Bacilli bacterium]|nr:GerMN domain-containing protein [Bacilli bacterium]